MPSDGLFEFQEDRMQLENGYLTIVFRAYPFLKRTVCFPDHYSMDTTDSDRDYVFPADTAAGGSSSGHTPESIIHETASMTFGQPRIAGNAPEVGPEVSAGEEMSVQDGAVMEAAQDH